MFLLTFTSIIREGIEACIFLFGVNTGAKPTGIPLAAVSGILVGALAGFIVYYTGRSIKRLKTFFIIMTVVLLLIAAGQFANGTNFLATAGMFGPYRISQAQLEAEEYGIPVVPEAIQLIDEEYADNPKQPWHYVPVGDFTACCSDSEHAKNPFFYVIHALLATNQSQCPLC